MSVCSGIRVLAGRSRRPVCRAAAVACLALAVATACARVRVPPESPPSAPVAVGSRDGLPDVPPGLTAQQLYSAYERLNTPARLRRQVLCGQTPDWLSAQAAYLLAMARRPADELLPWALQAADGYLARLEPLRTAKPGYRWPVTALHECLLQVLLAASVASSEADARLRMLARCDRLSPWERDGAVTYLIRAGAQRIPAESDPSGQLRAAAMAEALTAERAFVELLGGLRSVGERSAAVASLMRHDPLAIAKAFGDRPLSVPCRYARDAAVVGCVARSAVGRSSVPPAHLALVCAAAEHWLPSLRPHSAPDSPDFLTAALRSLTYTAGTERLAAILRRHGVTPGPGHAVHHDLTQPPAKPAAP